MRNSVVSILFSLFFVFTIHSSTESPPFSVNVLVEEGENVVDWEESIFGKKAQKKEKKSNEDVKKPEKKKKPDEKSEDKPNKTEKKVEESIESDEMAQEKPDPDVDEQKNDEKEFDSADPKWGRYYGETPQIEEKHQNPETENNEKEVKTAQTFEEEEEFIPVDILLWSHGGDGYLAMINTGVRVSYLNMYSTLSVGTDFSSSLERPMSLGVKFGGYYRIKDFLITADLGYEKIWDFGDNPELNDYALGLKAGLSYNVWSWVSISAGAGINYNVLKDSEFEQGRFAPMFFGGFEFNLMK